LISNFLIKTLTIFTRTLTSNSFKWTSSDFPSTQWVFPRRACKKFLPTLRFFCSSMKFPFTNARTPTSRALRPIKNTWMINQMKLTHSPESLAVISKLK
jgi:hypothetical protein